MIMMRYVLIVMVVVLLIILMFFATRAADSPVIYTQAVCTEFEDGYLCKDELFLEYNGVSTQIPEIQSMTVFFENLPK
jgi:hypothetical protein